MGICCHGDFNGLTIFKVKPQGHGEFDISYLIISNVWWHWDFNHFLGHGHTTHKVIVAIKPAVIIWDIQGLLHFYCTPRGYTDSVFHWNFHTISMSKSVQNVVGLCYQDTVYSLFNWYIVLGKELQLITHHHDFVFWYPFNWQYYHVNWKDDIQKLAFDDELECVSFSKYCHSDKHLFYNVAQFYGPKPDCNYRKARFLGKVETVITSQNNRSVFVSQMHLHTIKYKEYRIN
jgi:hypothetical protein